MDDISEKISSILNDPESFQTIKNIADSLMGDNSVQSEPTAAPGDFSRFFGDISPDQMGVLMRAMSVLNSKTGDNRTALLLALKPHLSPKRRDRVDKAVKLLKLAAVMPLVTESGIFNL